MTASLLDRFTWAAAVCCSPLPNSCGCLATVLGLSAVHGTAWLSKETMAERLQCDEANLKLSLRRMVAAGFLRRGRLVGPDPRYRTYEWHLVMPPEYQAASGGVDTALPAVAAASAPAIPGGVKIHPPAPERHAAATIQGGGILPPLEPAPEIQGGGILPIQGGVNSTPKDGMRKDGRKQQQLERAREAPAEARAAAAPRLDPVGDLEAVAVVDGDDWETRRAAILLEGGWMRETSGDREDLSARWERATAEQTAEQIAQTFAGCRAAHKTPTHYPGRYELQRKHDQEGQLRRSLAARIAKVKAEAPTPSPAELASQEARQGLTLARLSFVCSRLLIRPTEALAHTNPGLQRHLVHLLQDGATAETLLARDPQAGVKLGAVLARCLGRVWTISDSIHALGGEPTGPARVLAVEEADRPIPALGIESGGGP